MATSIEPGTVLAGKFRIDRVLGQGGMGVVVAAHHIQLDEQVAIKFLLPEALESREAVSRFEREARAAVKIKSEHIARVSDVGTLDTGAPYMVMEYLQGKDLSGVLEAKGPLPLEEAADYVLQACEAIAEAHALGIVHRDLKPPNLFLINRADGSPCVKVLDFGISKVTGPGGSHGMTSTGLVMGSPLYMSPEQLASAKDVDLRTDVWALGVILFELLTTRVPFDGESIGQLCTSILTQPPLSLLSLRPDLPKGVEDLINGCLAKQRDQRLANVAELANGLVAFAPKSARLSAERIERVTRAAGISSISIVLPDSPPSIAPVPAPAPASAAVSARTATAMGFVQTGAKAPASRMWVFGAAAAAVVAIGGIVVATRHSAPAEAPPVAAAAMAPSKPADVQPVAPPAPPPAAVAPAVAPAVAVAPAAAAAPVVPEAPKLVQKKAHPASAASAKAAPASAAPPKVAPPPPKAPQNSLGGRM